MRHTETPLQFVSTDFRGGNYSVIGLGHSVSFSTEVKKSVYLYFYSLSRQLCPVLLWTLPFARQKSETQFIAVHHVADRCDSNHCADCRQFRQDGTSVVTVSVGYSSSYYSEYYGQKSLICDKRVTTQHLAFFSYWYRNKDRLCGLVVSVSGYRYRGPAFDSRRYQIFWVVVGLERGPLSLVRSTEELLE